MSDLPDPMENGPITTENINSVIHTTHDDDLAEPPNWVAFNRAHGFMRISKTRRGGLHILHDGPYHGNYLTPTETATFLKWLNGTPEENEQAVKDAQV